MDDALRDEVIEAARKVLEAWDKAHAEEKYDETIYQAFRESETMESLRLTLS